MDYYESLIIKVKELIQNEDYSEANSILKEELSMPYIPHTHEGVLQRLYKECETNLQVETKAKRYDDEDIEALLFGSLEEACIACEVLKGSNVRQHLEVIEKYLKGDPHFFIRAMLVEILSEQDIHDEIEMRYEGLDVTFIPSYVEAIIERETTKMMMQTLSDYFENDNPTFFAMCVECLAKELYLKLPFSIDEDEINYVLVAIIEYVFKANGEEEGYNRFISEKSLAMYSGYDLLLYTYGI